MKIKQVEELVGITRKNIRFYEEQGLLQVARADNGYREYHMQDVRRLQQIRLLRKLSVPLEDIRALFAGTLRLDTCLSRQTMQYERQKRDLDQMTKFCDAGKCFAGISGCGALSGTDGASGKGGNQFYGCQQNRCTKEAKKRCRAWRGVYDLRDARGDCACFVGEHTGENPNACFVHCHWGSRRHDRWRAGCPAQQTQRNQRRRRR